MNIEEQAIFRGMIDALIEQESDWQHNATSSSSAR